MIDFRYHLISIVAVLLALSLGILVGSGFLGDPLFDDLERRADAVRESNADLRDLADELRDEIQEGERFADAVEPLITQDRLSGREVVVIAFDGTDGALVGAIQERVSAAGASIPTVIRVSSNFDLTTEADQELLALILRSTLATPEELRTEAGRLIGTRAAAVAAGEDDGGRRSPVRTRLTSLLDELEEADFLSIEAVDPERVVPGGAMFLVVGGSRDAEPFAIDEFGVALCAALAEFDAAVLAAEPTPSVWGLADALRTESGVAQAVSSVDNADTIPGRISIILGLERAALGLIGHYGTDEKATEVIPSGI
ncbi:MAG TPA: copper transporter [Actinomycetota bacterium]|nr:copper transporter [Actinomycetota bacterium]